MVLKTKNERERELSEAQKDSPTHKDKKEKKGRKKTTNATQRGVAQLKNKIQKLTGRKLRREGES